jgi:hypothetical protein
VHFLRGGNPFEGVIFEFLVRTGPVFHYLPADAPDIGVGIVRVVLHGLPWKHFDNPIDIELRVQRLEVIATEFSLKAFGYFICCPVIGRNSVRLPASKEAQPTFSWGHLQTATISGITRLLICKMLCFLQRIKDPVSWGFDRFFVV